MPLDDHLKSMIDMMESAGVPPLHSGTPEWSRNQYRARTVGVRSPDSLAAVDRVRELSVAGGDGDLRARAYYPVATTPVPTIVFFHGGGWVVGDLDTHDGMARAICRHTDTVVVSVEYRVAPDHPFPAAVDDAVASVRWVFDNLHEFGGSGRLAVAGDSAGGNLAAVAAQILRDAGGPPLAGQFLIYPPTDARGEYLSRVENGTGYLLDTTTMDWFLGHYAPNPADHQDERISPVNAASLAHLPPAVIVTAEFDPLRDEAEDYGRELRIAGVPVEVVRCDGMIHGFFDMGAASPGAQQHIERTCRLFAKALNQEIAGAGSSAEPQAETARTVGR
ncbi:alpha/beta hydrolase [Rhodococcus sp. ABRD24]|uniref:alpha/beta hydrolase n=1 Tax=Rhodococcus sp. ABRD24 TaxID=2507582 RepID=UPI00103D2063|nr:alpha/beta hydrolase [Rhodococcus sp. ABRD24]QBJ96564.1 alpha/beta hydrolase [Rhodococcus sp. ABRD24]